LFDLILFCSLLRCGFVASDGLRENLPQDVYILIFMEINQGYLLLFFFTVVVVVLLLLLLLIIIISSSVFFF